MELFIIDVAKVILFMGFIMINLFKIMSVLFIIGLLMKYIIIPIYKLYRY